MDFGQAAAVNNITDFSFYGDERQLAALHQLYGTRATDGPRSLIRDAGSKTLQTIATINGKLARNDKGELLPYEPEKAQPIPKTTS